MGAGGIGGLLARTDANGSAFYHADGTGNIAALIDETQNIVARYEYDPFLRPLGIWGSLGSANIMRGSSMPTYNGGIIGFWGRTFDTVPKRWLSPDPTGLAGGINLYDYVRNSPINLVDPYGLDYGAVIPQPNGTYVNIWDPAHPIAPFPPPTDPISVATDAVGAWDYTLYNPFNYPFNWMGFRVKCNKFVGDCISKCPNRPQPLISNGRGGKRYPTALEWGDPNISIPGYGPPHSNPQPGDVVTEGGHMGFMGPDGFIEAPTYRAITILPFNNPIWNPSTGRTPTP